jgi:hypothetical protein
VAISTNTILGTMEFCKRFNFNRPSGIGNALEPAKTSANLVMQAILSPPFKWLWNTTELTFTCSPTAVSSNLTGNVSVTGNVLSATVATTIGVNQIALLSGFTAAGAIPLNGLSVAILTNTGSAITAQILFPDLASTSAAGGAITAGTTQDYTLLVPNFSHIEHASALDISRPATPKWLELEVKGNLALESNTARPLFIEPHTEDANGNVTFRVMPAPNLAYPISIHAQNTAPLVKSLNQTWAPIPDYMAYIYNWGFLALMWSFSDDPRAQMASQKFVTHLLGRATGITATERNIFLSAWNDLTALEVQTQAQGIQARAQG